MKKILLVLLIAATGCAKTAEYPSPFGNKLEGEFKVSMKAPKDNNGYYHYQYNTAKEYDYTSIYTEASAITNERYIYNGTSVIEGAFDSDSYWIMGENIGIKLPLYNPFRSLYSSPYFTTPLPVGTKTIVLSQYKNFIVEVVPTSPIYFKKYDSRMDEYVPKGNNLWTKRIIGPIPKYMRGDTIKVYANIAWECGNYSLTHPERTHKIDSINLIID
jgi:hypothetical protein